MKRTCILRTPLLKDNLATQQWIIVEKNTEKRTAIVFEQWGGTDIKNKNLVSKCEAGGNQANR